MKRYLIMDSWPELWELWDIVEANSLDEAWQKQYVSSEEGEKVKVVELGEEKTFVVKAK